MARHSDDLNEGGYVTPGFCLYLRETELFNSESDVVRNFDALVDMSADYLDRIGYTRARHIMELTLDLKEGVTRDDGITPSALHDMSQFLWFVSCLEDGLHADDPEGVMINIFAHDLGEEFGLMPEDLVDYLVEAGFDMEGLPLGLADNHHALSKYYDNDTASKREKEQLFTMIAESRNASVVKPLDRIHNIATMPGVRDENRAQSYIASTERSFKPKIETLSTQKFPSQGALYDSLIDMLESTSALVLDSYNPQAALNDQDLEQYMPARGFKNLPDGLNPVRMVGERTRALHPDLYARPEHMHDTHDPS